MSETISKVAEKKRARQLQTVDLLWQGKTEEEIARIEGVSRSTVARDKLEIFKSPMWRARFNEEWLKTYLEFKEGSPQEKLIAFNNLTKLQVKANVMLAFEKEHEEKNVIFNVHLLDKRPEPEKPYGS